jgi:hypothetical protein
VLNGTWVYGSSADQEYLLVLAANGTYTTAFREPAASGGERKISPSTTGTWSRTGPWEYRLAGGTNPVTLLYDAEADLLVVKEMPQNRFLRDGSDYSRLLSATVPESPIYNTAEVKAHVAEKMTDFSQMSADLIAGRQSAGVIPQLDEFDTAVKDEIAWISLRPLPLTWELFRSRYTSALSLYGAGATAYREAQRFDAYSRRWQDLLGEGTRDLQDGDAAMGTAAAALPGATPAPAPQAGHTPRPACRGSDLEVVGDTMTLDAKGNGAITGTVVNCGARRFTGVKVVPSLYDSKGSMVGITMDTTREIAPYGSWNFSASVFIPNVSRYTIDDVEYASFTL